MKRIIILVVVLIFNTQLGFGQTFVNLNFESTTLTTNGSPGTVSTSIGLPGWIAFIGGATQSTMLYNNGTLGSSAIAILGEGNSLTPVIGGNFSTALTGGAGGDAMISQTGLVPANANTMFFDMYAQGYGPMDLAVSLNGQAINTLLYSTSSGYNTYAADVSSFAGQTANLAFNAVSSYPAGFEIFVLDDISFSPTVAPEPGALGLFALGSLLLGYCRWRQSPRL